MSEVRIITAEQSDEEVAIDRAIRPQLLKDYQGQLAVTEQLEIFIPAAKGRSEALDHLLFFGPPGLGKTTLAHIVANEMQATLHSTSGPVLERPGDLAALQPILSLMTFCSLMRSIVLAQWLKRFYIRRWKTISWIL